MDESLTIGVPSRRCEVAEVVSSYWWFLHNEKSPATWARACPQLSQMTAAAKWMPARKFLAVLS
jgi:hypothetical protein